MSMKNPATPPGIDPQTVRLVAQHLNHYDTQAPTRDYLRDLNVDGRITLTLNLPTTTIVAQPFNVIKWQLNFNPVA
jgi:hypothetical protein